VASPGVDVAVIGGGIAGLAAARALHARGLAIVLLEAGPRFGGVIRTERADGFLLEGGPDTFLASKPDGLRLCQELGLGPRIVPTDPRRSRVYVARRGRLHPLPAGMVLGVPTAMGPLLRSGLFTWRGKLRMALEPWRSIPPPAGDVSIADFIGTRLGREAVEVVGEPLLAGIHAGDAERLSIRATFPRLVDAASRPEGLVRGLRARQAPSEAAPPGFVSLEGGLGEMVDALVAGLPAVALRPGTPVRALRRERDGFVVETAGGPVLARTVVLALPAPRAAPLVAGFSGDAAKILAGIPFASTATVLLGYRRADVAHPLDAYGVLIPRGEGVRTTAITFSSTKLPGRASDGHVLLRGFLGGVRDPDVVDLDDARLLAIAQGDLRGLLGIRGEPVLRRAYRWPQATPQMEVGHLERVAAIDSHLARAPGLFLTGAGLRATGIPDVIADATRAAGEAALVARR